MEGDANIHLARGGTTSHALVEQPLLTSATGWMSFAFANIQQAFISIALATSGVWSATLLSLLLLLHC